MAPEHLRYQECVDACERTSHPPDWDQTEAERALKGVYLLSTSRRSRRAAYLERGGPEEGPSCWW